MSFGKLTRKGNVLLTKYRIRLVKPTGTWSARVTANVSIETKKLCIHTINFTKRIATTNLWTQNEVPSGLIFQFSSWFSKAGITRS